MLQMFTGNCRNNFSFPELKSFLLILKIKVLFGKCVYFVFIFKKQRVLLPELNVNKYQILSDVTHSSVQFSHSEGVLL